MRSRLLFTIDSRLALGACLTASALLGACAPSFQPEASNGFAAKVSIKVKRSQLNTSAGESFALPDDLCYVVAVTGDGIAQQLASSDTSCGPESGMGTFTGQAYNKGDTATIELKVGVNRGFELIGFVSPLGTQNGRAVCGSFASEVIRDGERTRPKFSVNGVEVMSHPILFARGQGSIAPGDNEIALEAIPKLDTPLTSQLAFGMPYLRADFPTHAQSCVPMKFRPALAPNKIVTRSGSGSGVAHPVHSTTGSGHVLDFVTTTPEIFFEQAAQGGRASLRLGTHRTGEMATGLAEIADRRNPYDDEDDN